MFLGWGILLAVIGGCIGWALRALKSRGELARARQSTVDADEVERMRRRLASLDEVTAERDNLRMQVADMRGTDSPGVVGAAAAAAAAATATEVDEAADAPGSVSAPPESDPPIDAAELGVARTVLGKAIELDDLTVVDGIGPKIAELCGGIGITTWRQLADSDLATLQSMLDDAGSRYRVHDPRSWPDQAACLADRRWDDFVALNARLADGR